MSEQREISLSFDIWSLGCVFYEIINFEKAFKSIEILKRYELPILNETIPLASIIKQMFQYNPEHRPSSRFILKTLLNIVLNNSFLNG